MNKFVKLTTAAFKSVQVKASLTFTNDVAGILKTFTSTIENLENHVSAQEARMNARAVRRAKLVQAIEASHNLDDVSQDEIIKARNATAAIRQLIGA